MTRRAKRLSREDEQRIAEELAAARATAIKLHDAGDHKGALDALLRSPITKPVLSLPRKPK